MNRRGFVQAVVPFFGWLITPKPLKGANTERLLSDPKFTESTDCTSNTWICTKAFSFIDADGWPYIAMFRLRSDGRVWWAGAMWSTDSESIHKIFNEALIDKSCVSPSMSHAEYEKTVELNRIKHKGTQIKYSFSPDAYPSMFRCEECCKSFKHVKGDEI